MKISMVFIIMTIVLIASCTNDEVQTPIVCTDVYNPVCGANGITYGNDCYAIRAGITSFVQGECEQDNKTIVGGNVNVSYSRGYWNYKVLVMKATPCHHIDISEIVDGNSVVVDVRTIFTSNQNTLCPQVLNNETVTGRVRASSEKAFALNLEGVKVYEQRGFRPSCPPGIELVCGQPPMPHCNTGEMCIEAFPPPITYSNTCLLSHDGARLLYAGECREQPNVPIVEEPSEEGVFFCSTAEKAATVCTMEYMPVCGDDGVTYGNKCGACAGNANSYTLGVCA
jgi:hypothetical protein